MCCPDLFAENTNLQGNIIMLRFQKNIIFLIYNEICFIITCRI